jgi:hypothetical protein
MARQLGIKMKAFTNDIILIVFKNGAKRCFSVQKGRSFKDSYFKILQMEEIDKEHVEKWFAFDKTLYSPEQYEKYWDVETRQMQVKDIVIDSKLEDFRQQRSKLFPVLDQEFMKSLEEDCEECKAHVVRIKNYLRDAPSVLEKFFEKCSADRISNFNPYNNVFDVTVMDPGSGYATPPKLKIQGPNGTYPGLPLKAVAMLTEDGSLSEVIVTQVGSGYREEPKIIVSKPDDPTGKQAKCIAGSPENDILENISWKETRMTEEIYEKSIKKMLNLEE